MKRRISHSQGEIFLFKYSTISHALKTVCRRWELIRWNKKPTKRTCSLPQVRMEEFKLCFAIGLPRNWAQAFRKAEHGASVRSSSYASQLCMVADRRCHDGRTFEWPLTSNPLWLFLPRSLSSLGQILNLETPKVLRLNMLMPYSGSIQLKILPFPDNHVTDKT